MRKLGKTNIYVNEIGCGGIPFQRVSQNTVNEMIDKMIELNINFIDTARGYTNSEQLIGEAIKNKRDKFYLATKSMARSYEKMWDDIKISLNNLQTSYIDLYQLHNVSPNENIDGALKALNEAKEQGLINHIGITMHSIEKLEEVINDNYYNSIETIQFPYNIVEIKAEQLFKQAYEKNLGIIVMKPLAGGAINNGTLALKFILNNPYISVVIPGMESVKQVIENGNVKKGEYTSKEQHEINEIKHLLDNDFCRRCGYCMPCPQGINIPFAFLCEGYYTRYGLKEWGKSRYDAMSIKPSKCIKCGLCETKCPYNLKIRDKIQKVIKIMEEDNEK